MSSLLASVVIPTRNRLQAIEKCLDALAAQTMPGWDGRVSARFDRRQVGERLERGHLGQASLQKIGIRGIGRRCGAAATRSSASKTSLS